MIPLDVIQHHIGPYLQMKEFVILCATCREFQKWLTNERWTTALQEKWDMFVMEREDNLLSGCAIAYGLAKEMYIVLHPVKKRGRDHIRVVEIYDSEKAEVKLIPYGVWFDEVEYQLKIGIPNRAHLAEKMVKLYSEERGCHHYHQDHFCECYSCLLSKFRQITKE